MHVYLLLTVAFDPADQREAMNHSANSSVASLAIWNNPVAISSSLPRPSLTQWLDTIPCDADEEVPVEAAAQPVANEEAASEAAATAASDAAADMISHVSQEGSTRPEASEHSLRGSEPSMRDEQQDVTPGLPISVNCRMVASPHGVRTWSDNDLRSSVDVRRVAANWPPATAPAAVPSAEIQLGERPYRLFQTLSWCQLMCIPKQKFMVGLASETLLTTAPALVHAAAEQMSHTRSLRDHGWVSLVIMRLHGLR